MSRVSSIDVSARPDLDALTKRIQDGRKGMLNIYRVLLHSPPIAASWLEHIGAVRWATQLDGRLREILIIRIAQMTGATYALRQHVPRLAEAEGLLQKDCASIDQWRISEVFSEKEKAALGFAEAMTNGIQVPDNIFDPLNAFFDERQIVELTVLIAACNMHNRFVCALNVDLETQ